MQLDDLENQSRHNNLRVMGLPKSFNSDSLQDICSSRIPSTLRIASPCIVERAHCLKTPFNDRCTDSLSPLFESHGQSQCLEIILQLKISLTWWPQDSSLCGLFAGSFTKTTCVALYQKKVKFTLAYPAIVHFTDPSGYLKSFSNLEEVTHYLQAYLHISMDVSSTTSPSHMVEPRDQRSPKKDPPKKIRLFNSSGHDRSH